LNGDFYTVETRERKTPADAITSELEGKGGSKSNWSLLHPAKLRKGNLICVEIVCGGGRGVSIEF